MKKIAVVLMAVSLSATAVAAVKNTSGSIADSGATQYLGARLGSNNAWSTSSKDSMTNDNTDLLKGFSYSYNEVTKAMTITVNEGSFREDSTYKNGDLFLHFNLNSVSEVASSGADRSDLSGSSKGIDWNDGFGFVFDTQSSKIYGGNFGIEYAGTRSATGVTLTGNNVWTGVTGRNGQEVGYGKAGSGKLVSTTATDSSLSFVNDKTKGELKYTFNLESLAQSNAAFNISNLNNYLRSGSLDLSARWTMSCANDVVQGRFTIPEPSMFALLGLGMLGLVGLRRRA